eukprot:gnl/TRDRNA2_/TRDRNA2_183716_c0_seq1.p1 gnl/TRDRNA2_/TRDRNA2_183716_c0~~gnl/TRDRNA2_/TRDRNA2_183716_c0_seq1.p1  ORF type:complete len:331 (-),score=35.01 gnl/TRDRNA2_/TRDRNA2_183716_c0_seq1:85-1077(-)
MTSGSHPYDVCLTVFLEGTSNAVRSLKTQIGLFAMLIDGLDVTTHLPSGWEEARHLKMAFDGCGVTYGLGGILFGCGLDSIAEAVKDRVLTLREGVSGSGPRDVRLNAVGLSRGGVGVIYLCKLLAEEAHVHINALLFDPVPGNLVTFAKADLLSISNASRCMDMSECDNVVRLLVLYPHEPLPDHTCHAPVVPAYPENCDVEEDVIPGCHQGALFLTSELTACVMSFARIRGFLTDCGCRVRPYPAMEVDEKTLLQLLDDELEYDYPTERATHSLDGDTAIVRHSQGDFLNRYHWELTARNKRGTGSCVTSDPTYMLEIVHGYIDSDDE